MIAARLFLAGIVCISLFSGCTPDDTTRRLRVAEQHGLAYAPLALLRTPDARGDSGGSRDFEIEWVRLNNAAAIREAMLADRLDVGFMGIPPYLIGRDRDTGWRAFTGLSRAPLGLVTVHPGIPDFETLADPDRRFRVALPQPGSIQHILLSIALDRRYGDPTRLDDRLVSMGHPDAMNALLAGTAGETPGASDIAAHFSSPPFLFREMRHPAARVLLTGDEAFGGEFTFIIGVLRRELSGDAPAVRAFERALKEAVTAVTTLQEELRRTAVANNGSTDNRGASYPRAIPASLTPAASDTLARLSRFYGIDAAELAVDLTEEGLVYEEEIRGLETFASRMTDYGYLSAGTDTGVVR